MKLLDNVYFLCLLVLIFSICSMIARGENNKFVGDIMISAAIVFMVRSWMMVFLVRNRGEDQEENN